MKHRTRVSLFGSSVLIVLLLCAGFALAFTDVSPGDDYSQAISDLTGLNIINGFTDGSFRPGELVTRQQFAKMIVLSLGLPVTEGDICPFSDVDSSGASNLYPDNYVAVAAARGITKGVSTYSFAPFRNITRAQVVTMVVRAAPLAGVTLSQPTSSYYNDPKYTMRNFNDPTHGRNAQIAELSGLLWGIRQDPGGGWDPYKNATRGEVAQILWRLRQKMAPPTTTPPTTEPPATDLLAYDDFSDPNSGWAEETYSNSRIRYSGGTYRIDVTAPQIETMSWWGTVYDDVSVGVFAKPSTRSGSWEYGLVFRLQDMQNLYQLSITGDDYAQLWKRVGGQWSQLSAPVELDPAASDGWRELYVMMLEDSFVAYVDDVGIGPVYDSTFTQGKVGFYAGTFDATTFSASYDDFAVWSIFF